jgi:hypothetical protein
MKAVPTFMPVTTPPWVTVAIVGSLVDQKMGRLLTGPPVDVTGCAANVLVAPRMTDAVSGVTRMSETWCEFGPVTSLAQAASRMAAAILP